MLHEVWSAICHLQLSHMQVTSCVPLRTLDTFLATLPKFHAPALSLLQNNASPDLHGMST